MMEAPKMNQLPCFSIDDYRALLQALLEAGYDFRTVTEMDAWGGAKSCYLRHDVDFHVVGADVMAEADADAGIRSTFFILVEGYYNIQARENTELIKRIASFGHEIGLHYDLRTFPEESIAAEELLGFQATCLERVSGDSVRSIVMHEPSAGHGDYFREHARYTHPHASRFSDVAYISDSCRAWRDERLLECLDPTGPQRLLLNLHPELWLDARVEDRIEYLRTVSAPTAALHTDVYFSDYMAPIWRTHEAVTLDRQRREKGSDHGDNS